MMMSLVWRTLNRRPDEAELCWVRFDLQTGRMLTCDW